jgi:hypothetical protein
VGLLLTSGSHTCLKTWGDIGACLELNCTCWSESTLWHQLLTQTLTIHSSIHMEPPLTKSPFTCELYP